MKNIYKSFISLSCALSLLSVNTSAQQTFYLQQDGAWSDASVWSAAEDGSEPCSVAPSSSDVVVIPSGKSVSLSSDAYASRIQLAGSVLSNGFNVYADELDVVAAISTTVPSGVYGDLIVESGCNAEIADGITINGNVAVYSNAKLVLGHEDLTTVIYNNIAYGLFADNILLEAKPSLLTNKSITINGNIFLNGGSLACSLNTENSVSYKKISSPNDIISAGSVRQMAVLSTNNNKYFYAPGLYTSTSAKDDSTVYSYTVYTCAPSDAVDADYDEWEQYIYSCAVSNTTGEYAISRVAGQSKCTLPDNAIVFVSPSRSITLDASYNFNFDGLLFDANYAEAAACVDNSGDNRPKIVINAGDGASSRNFGKVYGNGVINMFGGLFPDGDYSCFDTCAFAKVVFDDSSLPDGMTIQSSKTSFKTVEINSQYSVTLPEGFTIDGKCSILSGNVYSNGPVTITDSDDAYLSLSGNLYLAGSNPTLYVNKGSTSSISRTSEDYCIYDGSIVWKDMSANTEYTIPVGAGNFNGALTFSTPSSVDTWTFACNECDKLDYDYDSGRMAEYYWAVTPSADAVYSLVLPYNNKIGFNIDDADQQFGLLTASPSTSQYWNVAERLKVSNNKFTPFEAFSGSAAQDKYISLGNILYKVWLGSSSEEWSNSENWENNELGTSADTVVISSSASTMPYITSEKGVVEVSKVYIKNGAKLFVDKGSLQIDDKIVCVGDGLLALKNYHDQYAFVKGKVVQSSESGETDATNVRVDRCMEIGYYHYIGTAVTNSGENIGNAAFAIYNYNTSTGGFSSATTLSTEHGNAVAMRNSNHVFRQSGKLADTNSSTEFTVSPDYAYGWNFVYNPYAIPIPLDGSAVSFTEGVASDFLWFYVYDEGTDAYKYRVVECATGESVNSMDSVDEDDLYDVSKAVIMPYEAFFVQSLEEVDYFVIDPTEVDLSDYDNEGNTTKATTVANDILRLVVASEDYTHADEMAFRFKNNGSRLKTNKDASKIDNASYNAIFALKGTNKLTVATYPELSDIIDDEELPLGVNLLGSGTVTGIIKATNIANFDESVDVYLHDNVIGADINLRDVNTYTFSTTAGEDVTDRFTVSLNKSATSTDGTTSLSNLSSTDIAIATSGNQVLITANANAISSDSYVAIYDLSGRQIARKQISSTTTTLSLNNYHGLAVVSAKVSSQSAKARVLIK